MWMIKKYSSNVESVSVGHGAGTFNLALDRALQYNDNEVIYFLENDYLHLPGADEILAEGFSLEFPFVALYDHPDKYIDPKLGGNPQCHGGCERTRVYLTKSCHWKVTNSTTMTFAATVRTLKRTEPILRAHTCGTHPHDYPMFLDLIKSGETLITPIPGYATHGETKWLTPLRNWSKVQ